MIRLWSGLSKATLAAMSEGIAMGKIVGWASIDSEASSTAEDAAVKPQLTQIDAELFELRTENDCSQESVPIISVDTDDEEVQFSFEADDDGNEALCVSAEVIEDADSCGVASDEVVANESLDILQAYSSNQLVAQEDDCVSVELTKTERICQAIDNLQPSYHEDFLGKYCDITDASDKVIRALILSADPLELDFFVILEKLQEVACRQSEMARRYTSTLESDNLNSLIEFVGSLALNNARD